MLREMGSTYGRSPGGYLWVIAEPIGVIAVLSITARNLLLAGGPWSRPWTGAAGGERGLVSP